MALRNALTIIIIIFMKSSNKADEPLLKSLIDQTFPLINIDLLKTKN